MSLFSPLRQAAVAFFKHDVALRREVGGVQLVLEERGPGGQRQRQPSRAELAKQKEKAEVELMLDQLGALLDDVPETRQTMRHLVFVEQALVKKGLKALHKLPLDVLQHALAQLEGLVTNWSPVGLANLRSKMAVAIIDRDHLDHDAETDAYRTAAIMESPLPAPPALAPESTLDRSDDDALAAAYAALGALAPSVIETQSELGSRSARAVNPTPPRHSELGGEIKLRELQST
jgi:hypothetical protein